MGKEEIETGGCLLKTHAGLSPLKHPTETLWTFSVKNRTVPSLFQSSNNRQLFSPSGGGYRFWTKGQNFLQIELRETA